LSDRVNYGKYSHDDQPYADHIGNDSGPYQDNYPNYNRDNAPD
jgi:hypothetical protein